MRRSCCCGVASEPERVLHHGVAGEAAGVAVGGEELVDGFEGDFEAAEAEGRVAARVEAEVDELVVEQGNEFFWREGDAGDWA